MKQKNRIKMMALCGIFSAAELAIIYLSSVFQTIDLVIAVMTVAFTVVLLAEYGKKPSLVVYAVVTILSLLIVPNKFTPLCYALFIGIYPVIKPFFDRPAKPLSYLLKLVYFNVFYVGLYFIITTFAMLDDVFGIGTVMFFVTLGAANIAFLLCDHVIGLMVVLYTAKLRKKFGFEKIFRK